MKTVLQFLNDLAANNNREWFEAHKNRYLECRDKVLFATEVLMNEIRKFDQNLPVTDAKDCLFRIYRDVRFSEDKKPYKTHFGAFIAKGGRKSEYPGYYFHIQPGESFMGGGLYMPAPPILKALREHIAVHGNELEKIMNDDNFKSSLPEVYNDRIKTAPKGYPVNHPYIELLRYRSFAFTAHVSDKSLIDGTFFSQAVDAYRNLHKANEFMNEAIGDLL